MSFPVQPVLDTFTRANENPLSDGGNWAGPIASGDSQLAVVSDQANAPTDDNLAESYWTSAFAGDVQVYTTFASEEGLPYVMACVHSPGESAISGYQLATNGSDITLYRVDPEGGGATLATWTASIGDGDSIGLDVSGGVITGYHKPSAGAWTALGTVDDDTYESGYIGLGFASTGTFSGFTSFGGGGTAIQPALATTKRGLYLEVCDLNGNRIVQGTGRPLPVRTVDAPQVTIPISDSRTGQFDVSMYEPIAAALASVTDNNVTSAGTVVVKVLYVNPKGDETLLLNGILMNPDADFDAGTVTCQLHDSTIRLKKRFLGYDHASIALSWGWEVGGDDNTSYSDSLLTANGLEKFYGITSVYGVPLDGFGLRLLLLDTSHGAADWNGWPLTTAGSFYGKPTMGIRYQPDYSEDDANQQPDLVAVTSSGLTTYAPPTGIGTLQNGINEGEGFSATATEGSPTLTDVDFTGATNKSNGAASWSDLYEYGALDGPGIPEFTYIESWDEGASTITMSQEATENAAYNVPVSDGGGENAFVEQDSVYCQLTRGDCVYDDLTEMVQSQGAFECDWVPVDSEHKGPSNADWVEGQLCELYTANRLGTDRSKGNGSVTPVQFVHGLGGFHLVWSPDADQLITYEVQCSEGGPNDPNDYLGKVTYISNSQDDYGLWEDWQQATSAGNGDTDIANIILADRAAAVLTAYQNPPQFITATIDTDVIGAYCYGTDFFLGDTVTVYAKKGYVEIGPLDVRITQVEVSMIDANGNCQITLTMAPYLTANPGISSGDI